MYIGSQCITEPSMHPKLVQIVTRVHTRHFASGVHKVVGMKKQRVFTDNMGYKQNLMTVFFRSDGREMVENTLLFYPSTVVTYLKS